MCGGGWFGNSGGSGQREGVCEMAHWQGNLPPSLMIQGDLQGPYSRRDLTPGSCPLTSTCVLPCVQVHTQAHKSNAIKTKRTEREPQGTAAARARAIQCYKSQSENCPTPGRKSLGLGRPSTNQPVRTEKARETLPEVTCLLHGTGILQGWELAGSPSTSH